MKMGSIIEELATFLYKFALNVIDELEDKELPDPSKVWFVGADKSDFQALDKSDCNNEHSWQGNVDAKRIVCRICQYHLH